MTMTRILASTLIAAASFAAIPSAHAVIPGSDTYERARDNAAIQSVIEASAPLDQDTVDEGQSSYGFPSLDTSATRPGLVPGSSAVDDAADGRAIMSVINGTPGSTTFAAPGSTTMIVPGSDSF